MALPSATDVQYVGDNGVGGVVMGKDASALIGFYGKAPSAQRAYSSAVHATSALASSTDFTATHLAALQECQNTFIALGIWATA